LSFRTLQHLRTQVPFFSPFLAKKRLGSVALLPKSPVLRVWLPSRRRQRLKPLKASFSSQRSWASPYKAFFLFRDRMTLSNHPFRSYASLQNLPALYRRFNGFLPRKKRFPFLRARIVHPGRDPMLSWAFGPLRCSLRNVQIINTFFMTCPSRP
jgi:hypothetical protein